MSFLSCSFLTITHLLGPSPPNSYDVASLLLQVDFEQFLKAGIKVWSWCQSSCQKQGRGTCHNCFSNYLKNKRVIANENSCIHSIERLDATVRCQFSILELFKSHLFRLLFLNFAVGVANSQWCRAKSWSSRNILGRKNETKIHRMLGTHSQGGWSLSRPVHGVDQSNGGSATWKRRENFVLTLAWC